MRQRIAVALGVFALLAGCHCGQEVVVTPTAPPTKASLPVVAAGPAPVLAPAATTEPTAVVVSTSGTVEVRRGEGEWGQIKPGDKLHPADSVRTSEDGELEIALDEIRVRVHEQSVLKVKEIKQRVLRAQLKGRLSSDVKGGGRVEVEGAGSDAVAVSENGHFSMLSDGQGVVAVAAVQGQVTLSSAGKSIDVAEGQVGRVRPGKGLEAPTAALKKVLLAVEWPDAKETNRRSFTLTGKVEVGSRVRVQGRAVDVDRDGRFATQVALRQGRQRIPVQAIDVLGRRKQLAEGFLMDETLPDVKLRGHQWQ